MKWLSKKKRFNILLITASFAGVIIILYAASKNGIGIYTDSVMYLSVANNLAAFGKYSDYTGHFHASQPLLYPLIISAIKSVLSVDAVTAAKWFNAFVFGGIISFTGILLKKIINSAALFAIGLIAVLFSTPILFVSLGIFTEPLFLWLTLGYFIIYFKFRKNSKISNLLFLSVISLLAFLTRYAGGVLFLTTVSLIFINSDIKLKTKIKHVAVYLSLPVLLILIALGINYALTNTFVGLRSVSKTSAGENISLLFETIFLWFFHVKFLTNKVLFIIFLIVFLSLAAAALYFKRQYRKSFIPVLPFFLFSFIYSLFMVISATLTSMDPLGNRLLCPVFIPVVIIVLWIIDEIVENMHINNSKKVRLIFVSIMLIALLIPVRNSLILLKKFYDEGAGYNKIAWKDDALSRAVKIFPFNSPRNIFSNAPDVFYLRTGLNGQFIPYSNTLNRKNEIENYFSLKNNNKTYLVWFDKIKRAYLMPKHSLDKFVSLDTILTTRDGVIYSMKALK